MSFTGLAHGNHNETYDKTDEMTELLPTPTAVNSQYIFINEAKDPGELILALTRKTGLVKVSQLLLLIQEDNEYGSYCWCGCYLDCYFQAEHSHSYQNQCGNGSGNACHRHGSHPCQAGWMG
jgi:hypothetical protein